MNIFDSMDLSVPKGFLTNVPKKKGENNSNKNGKRSNDTTKKPKTTKKAETEYVLPLKVRYAQSNIILDTDNFGGLEKVTAEIVRKYLVESNGWVELSKKRAVMEYDEVLKVMFPILKGSSTKG